MKLRLLNVKLDSISTSTLVTKLNESLLGKASIDRTVMLSWESYLLGGRRTDRAAGLCQHDAWRHALLGRPLSLFLQQRGIHRRHRLQRNRAVGPFGGGVACMVSFRLALVLPCKWRSMYRAVRNLGKMFFHAAKTVAKTEVDTLGRRPMSWFHFQAN